MILWLIDAAVAVITGGLVWAANPRGKGHRKRNGKGKRK